MEKEVLKIYKEHYYHSGRKDNFNRWINLFSESYNNIAGKQGALKAVNDLISLKNETQTRYESLKSFLKDYTNELLGILIDKNKLTLDTPLDRLHSEIRLTARAGFSPDTLGNFGYGSLTISEESDLVLDITKDVNTYNVSYLRLKDKIILYLHLTKQRKSSVVVQFSKAQEKRFLADKLHYQIRVLELLIERIMLFDYPKKFPAFEEKEQERLFKFIDEKTSGTRSSPRELFVDIYYLIQRLEREHRDDPFLFRKNGELVYSVAAQYALDLEDDQNTFAEKWNKKKNKENGINKGWLEKKIKEVYVALFMD